MVTWPLIPLTRPHVHPLLLIFHKFSLLDWLYSAKLVSWHIHSNNIYYKSHTSSQCHPKIKVKYFWHQWITGLCPPSLNTLIFEPSFVYLTWAFRVYVADYLIITLWKINRDCDNIADCIGRLFQIVTITQVPQSNKTFNPQTIWPQDIITK